MKDYYDLVQGAIKAKKEILISFHTPWEGIQEEVIHPLGYGTDLYGFPFVWARLANEKYYYKYYVDMITGVMETGRNFEVGKGLNYPHQFHDAPFELEAEPG